MSFEARITSGAEWIAAMQQAPEAMRRELLAATNQLAAEGSSTAISLAPRDTGFLAGNRRPDPARFVGDMVIAGYTSHAAYSRYVEEGRGPIVPRRARALRFEIGGRVIFAKRVRPARALPYMGPSMERVRSAMVRVYGEAVRRAVRRSR
jgi:hypothetical protein